MLKDEGFGKAMREYNFMTLWTRELVDDDMSANDALQNRCVRLDSFALCLLPVRHAYSRRIAAEV
jgi:hypothetical protein